LRQVNKNLCPLITMMKKFLMTMLLLGVITIFPQSFLRAQFGESSDPSDDLDGPGDPNGDPDQVPLDPGTWILAAAGVGYGIKKWRDSQQNVKRNMHGINSIISENKVNDEN